MPIIKNNIKLSETECDKLIKYVDSSDIQDAKVTTDEHHYRTNKVCYLHKDNKLSKSVYKLVSDVTNSPIDNIETIQINKYAVGEYFKPHYDFLPETMLNNGGQRLYSVLIYLNSDFKGGETFFQHLYNTVSPKKGLVIAWKNCVSGTTELEYNSLHESLPVLEGTKYSLIAWVRESKVNI